ncbi:MAG: hypothetical protein Fur0039_14640 [Rhodocyclaceae bacterium]
MPKAKGRARWIAAAGAFGLAALACGAARAESWKSGASVSVRETYSDNIALSASGARRSDWVTEIVPRFTLAGSGPRLKAAFDYSLSELIYANGTSGNRTSNNLGANANAELVEKFLFLDARASIAQSTISAFGPVVTDNANTTSNRAETRAISLSPYIRGMLPAGLSYELRYGFSTSSSDSSQLQTTRTNQWNARVSRDNAFGPFGWGLEYSSSDQATTGRPTTESQRYTASVLYSADRQLKLNAFLGRENNNFSGGRSNASHGFGVEWLPSERTSITARRDQRFFGNGYGLRVSHRMPLSLFNLDYSRDISTSSQTQLAGVPVLFMPPDVAAFLAGIADPAARASATAALIAGGFIIPGIDQRLFATERILVVRRLAGSFSLRGARNTLTATASRSETQSASTGIAFTDSLTGASVLRSNTLGVNWTHTLSPLSSLSASAARSATNSDAAGSPTSRQTSLNLTLSSRLGVKTNGSLGLRHVTGSGSGGVTGYQENALVGTLAYTFF